MLAALPIEQRRDMDQRVLRRVALRLAVTADQPFNRWNRQGTCVARLLLGELPDGAVTENVCGKRVPSTSVPCSGDMSTCAGVQSSRSVVTCIASEAQTQGQPGQPTWKWMREPPACKGGSREPSRRLGIDEYCRSMAQAAKGGNGSKE
jgi:hypothetical protein